uniref:Protein kinase domain-containing protein n=1 Tax=Branchiostoma floridae TaxID=7739 RepID=C3ZB98_BRAFL|eukprot:XP_002594124.1 hypothetical protein BRAFLDRAFT_68434 [Branchiostoma floridae]
MDRYTNLRKLGQGAFGTVYKAKCTTDGITYALKRLTVYSSDSAELIQREINALRQIADFGLARVCGQTGAGGFNINQYYMDTIAGTRYYWPPEMLRHMLAQQADQVTYTAKTDIWAMGIIIAAILDRMIDPLRPGKLQPVIPVDEQAMPVAEAILRYPGFPLADMLMKSEPPGSRVKGKCPRASSNAATSSAHSIDACTTSLHLIATTFLFVSDALSLPFGKAPITYAHRCGDPG